MQASLLNRTLPHTARKGRGKSTKPCMTLSNFCRQFPTAAEPCMAVANWNCHALTKKKQQCVGSKVNNELSSGGGGGGATIL